MYSIEKINIDFFDFSKNEDASLMFQNCHLLKEINLKNYIVSSSIKMKSIFYESNSLENINLKNFNRKEVTVLDHMFYG